MAARVFVFTTGEYSDYGVDWATADKYAAKKYAAEMGKTLSEIEKRRDLIVFCKNGEALKRQPNNRPGIYRVSQRRNGDFITAHKVEDAPRPQKPFYAIGVNVDRVRIPSPANITGFTGRAVLMTDVYRDEPYAALQVEAWARNIKAAKRHCEEARCELIDKGTWDNAVRHLGGENLKPGQWLHITDLKIL